MDASNFLGWVSLGCWLIVGFPQFYQLYRTKSGEAMSIAFLSIWGVGDIFNVIGCILTQQLFTQLAIAIWYTIMDATLITQIYYYDKWFPDLKYQVASDEEASFFTTTGGPTMGQPVPRRRSTFSDMPPTEQLSSSFESAPRGFMNQTRRLSEHRKFEHNQTLFMSTTPLLVATIVLLALHMLGDEQAIGSASYSSSVGRTLLSKVLSEEGACSGSGLACALGLVLGWASSILYVVSRLPQLYKNWARKSCEGLSVWMFFFGVIGNATYSASIFIKSTEYEYLMNSLPYIIGSIGTLGFDLSIFCQFYIYRDNVDTGGYTYIK
eukprot:CFRG4521T1